MVWGLRTLGVLGGFKSLQTIWARFKGFRLKGFSRLEPGECSSPFAQALNLPIHRSRKCKPQLPLNPKP